MPNMLMMRYAGSKGNENENRNERMGGMGGGMRNEMAGGNQNVYNRELESRNEYGDTESRYRGIDGRWKSGRRRSEYDGGEMTGEEWPENRRNNLAEMRQYNRMAGGDDEEEKEYEVKVKPSNVVEWPYGEPREEQAGYRYNRQIGFGAQNTMGGDYQHQALMMGKSEGQPMEFDRETAEQWVHSMKNEDKQHPVGGKWSADMLKPLAQKYGIPTDGKKFWEFYAMTNAMYSDYGEVARKFGITSPEYYVCMAKAWMEDKDAEKDKTARYYEYVVKKDHAGSAA